MCGVSSGVINTFNRKTLTVSGAEDYIVTYTYDENNRLIEEKTVYGGTREYKHFRYDSNGNQLTKEWEKYSKIAENTTASVGFKKKSDVEMFEARVYNGFNQLVSVFADNVNTTYQYRPDGLRHGKETFDYKSTQNTVHLWDGQNICAEQNASGVFARYLRGVNLIARRQDNLDQYYHFNAHGDVVQRTDYNGVVLKSYDYGAFGVEQDIEKMDSNPFRYSGEYFEKSSGDYYLRNRLYNPVTGRFTSEDPIGDGLNWYTYCGNNPLMFVDPLGLAAVFNKLLKSITAAANRIIAAAKSRSKNSSSLSASTNARNGTYTAVAAIPFIPVIVEGIKGTIIGLGLIGTFVGGLVTNAEESKESAKDKAPDAPSKQANEESESTVRLPENKAQNDHIFRDAEGHIADTPENRRLLEETANDSSSYLGKDKYGNDWHGRIRDDGSQVWTQSRNGTIINGGVNQTPRPWNPDTGLSRPYK